MPVIGRSKQKAKKIHCVSNLRQSAIAGFYYSDDNDDELLPAAIWDPAVNVNREWSFAYLPGSSEVALREGLLGPYLENVNKVLRCPSVNYTEQIIRAQQIQGRPLVGYGYNSFKLSRQVNPVIGHWRGYLRSAVRRPSATIMFADSGRLVSGLLSPSTDITAPSWPHADGRPRATVHGVHSGLANVAWLDGHVSSKELAPYDRQSVNTRTYLGYLDPNKDNHRDDQWFNIN